MLLNWTTVDSCFLSSHLHIRTRFQFFLTCLAAFLLVISLEFLRRCQRRFDRYLRNKNTFLQESGYAEPDDMTEKLLDKASKESIPGLLTKKRFIVVYLEQIARGLIHAAQFSISYCIMLLFMYSNGTNSTSNVCAFENANIMQDMLLCPLFAEH